MIGLEITILAVAYVAFSVTMQRKLTNPRRTFEIQQEIKRKTNELNEMVRSKATQEQLNKKQKEVTGLLSESMRSQMKPMFVILPIFFIMFYLVFPAIIPASTMVTVPVVLMKFDYKTYFIIVAFILGFAMSMGFMLYDKIKMGGKKQDGEQAQPAQQA